MNVFHVILLAFVEGLTEFLPVSSTGHLVLLAHLLGLNGDAFTGSFIVIIQLGAIAAVLSIYMSLLIKHRRLWGTLLYSFLPTVLIGVGAYTTVKDVFLTSTSVTTAALFLGGIALIILERFHKKRNAITSVHDITPRSALMIGLTQSLSIIPGVSRAAATIYGGILTGLDRKTAVEYSFLLAVPTMIAATGWDLINAGTTFDAANYLHLAIGLGVSWITAIAAIRYFLRFISSHSFVAFGIYRIAIAIIFWTFLS